MRKIDQEEKLADAEEGAIVDEQMPEAQETQEHEEGQDEEMAQA